MNIAESIAKMEQLKKRIVKMQNAMKTAQRFQKSANDLAEKVSDELMNLEQEFKDVKAAYEAEEMQSAASFTKTEMQDIS